MDISHPGHIRFTSGSLAHVGQMSDETSPPTNAPITPRTIVMISPIDCRPGRRARAISPTTSPVMIQLNSDSMAHLPHWARTPDRPPAGTGDWHASRVPNRERDEG